MCTAVITNSVAPRSSISQLHTLSRETSTTGFTWVFLMFSIVIYRFSERPVSTENQLCPFSFLFYSQEFASSLFLRISYKLFVTNRTNNFSFRVLKFRTPMNPNKVILLPLTTNLALRLLPQLWLPCNRLNQLLMAGKTERKVFRGIRFQWRELFFGQGPTCTADRTVPVGRYQWKRELASSNCTTMEWRWARNVCVPAVSVLFQVNAISKSLCISHGCVSKIISRLAILLIPMNSILSGSAPLEFSFPHALPSRENHGNGNHQAKSHRWSRASSPYLFRFISLLTHCYLIFFRCKMRTGMSTWTSTTVYQSGPATAAATSTRCPCKLFLLWLPPNLIWSLLSIPLTFIDWYLNEI